MCALAKAGLKTTAKKAKKTKKVPAATTLKKAAGKKASAIAPAKSPAKAPGKSSGKSESGSLAVSLLGKKAPSFTARATAGKEIVSTKLSGKPWVLYFYPKDHTPGCTVEGQDFKKYHAKFQALGCEIFGVSKDSLKRHESFKEKFGFPFELIADEDEALCRKFDVIQMKKLYGREYEGIERSTFLVDAKGVVRGEWRRVKVPAHVDAVLSALENLDA